MISMFFSKDNFLYYLKPGDAIIYNDCIHADSGHVSVKIIVNEIDNDKIIYTYAMISRKNDDGRIVFDDNCATVDKNVRMKISYKKLSMYAPVMIISRNAKSFDMNPYMIDRHTQISLKLS